ncbi:MAG: chemotaxis protein CheD [Verrucomicrobia bacterium]|nr:chemotaxis protein CheD [Verrucomicrobiota bacterium]MBU1735582.1 chemotaxis protein CheD [Verrucomicrobiota bacterium]
MEPIKVGMAEYKVVTSPALLTSIGLGSCIGLVLYDAINKIGALAHIMLPKQSEAKNKSNPAKFADTSIDLMLAEMEARGAFKRNIKAKLFGGANMFPNVQGKVLMNVGARNAAAVKEELTKRKIAVVAEDLGGHCGRTIVFDTRDGSVRVKTIKGENVVY